jgi:dipeptidyl aminopeptidase/acylaminoacyl peptidase
VFRPITDEARILEIARQISPANHVSDDDPPTLIIHGDADVLVPIQQAELILDKLKRAGVEGKLVVKKGAITRLARPVQGHDNHRGLV